MLFTRRYAHNIDYLYYHYVKAILGPESRPHHCTHHYHLHHGLWDLLLGTYTSPPSPADMVVGTS